jgi:hypothetical protein
MATIPVIVEPLPKETGLEEPTLGRSGPPTPVRRLVAVDADVLRASLGGLTEQLGTLFQDLKAVGDFRLKEVAVSIEISASGGVALIGKAEAGATGAISLTFSP